MSNISQLSDAELYGLGQHGFAMAMQLLRNRDDAADAVQDAMCSAWRKQTSYESAKGEIKSWFLKIVRNRCLDLIRKRQRRGTTVPISAAIEPADANSPDSAADQDGRLTVIKAELLKMNGEQREIILLRDFHGLAYGEISKVLGVANGTVMSRLHRARLELRRRVNAVCTSNNAADTNSAQSKSDEHRTQHPPEEQQ
jgi:RNA polymerase sigma-70 factor (ECF subfamily)